MTREEREKAIDALKFSAPLMAVTQGEFNDYIQTLNKIMDWLEQEPCDDAISRQAVLKAIDAKAWEFCDYLISKGRNDEQKPVSHFADNLRECISEDLPPVTPAEKVGHWIDHQEDRWIYAKCSECETVHDTRTNYCPHCGAKMGGDAE